MCSGQDQVAVGRWITARLTKHAQSELIGLRFEINQPGCHTTCQFGSPAVRIINNLFHQRFFIKCNKFCETGSSLFFTGSRYESFCLEVLEEYFLALTVSQCLLQTLINNTHIVVGWRHWLVGKTE